MIVGKAIYHLLTNATDVTDIVSTRIYPEIAQQDADLPYIVYNVANNEPTDTKPEPSKLDTAQVEVNIYSDSYTECIDLAVAVRAALDRVKGTYNGVNVQSIQYLNEIIDFDEPQRAYNISADYDVRISRTDFEIAQGSPITGVQLGELSDVDVTGVTNGQVIAYNNGVWENADDAGGAESLNDLTDVNITLPENRNFLMYDGEEWVEDNVSKSDVGLGNVDNTSDADKPVSTATQTALDAKADTSAVPTTLNDLSDVSITATPTGNEALIYDGTAGVFKSLPNFSNRFEDDVERGSANITPFVERAYGVKSDGDGIFIDNQSDTPSAGKVIVRKIYHKAGLITDTDVIGDYTLIHTFADDTAYSATESTFEGFRDGDTYGSPPFTLIQTWEEQTAAPAFTGLLNESYGSGAAAAYSVRRLNGNYTGAAIEVERIGDPTTQDIGFDSNGDLDESALTTFCTGYTCRVRTWYDQSQTGGTGSGNDAVQTDSSKRPTIFTGGAIVKDNGRVAFTFDGTDNSFNTSWSAGDTSAFTAFNIASPTNNTTASQLYDLRDANDDGLRLLMFSDSNLFYSADATDLRTTAYISGRQLVYSNYASSTIATGIDGATTNTSSAPASTSVTANAILFRDGTADTFYFNGKAQEAIFYASDKSTDRTSIESNIGDYFTQNTPLLDTYTGAAAAYSLRKLRTAYTGNAVTVRRASDNFTQGIGFNVFGELDTVSLAAFCGASDGFVDTWHDQSGNANDATQSTTANQPKIYDSSTGVVTENGKPALEFDGSNDGYLLDTTGLDIGSLSSFTVGRMITISNAVMLGLSGSDNNRRWYAPFVASGNFNYGYADSATAITTTQDTNQNLHTMIAGTTLNGVEAFLNSTSVGTDTRTTGAASGQDGIGNLENNFYANCNVQEVIVYGSDQSANRTNIEDNINTFYSIY